MESLDQASSKELEKRELLLKVYDAAVNEYRFNVNLAWDRTKFYLSILITAIAAGVGLMRFAADNMVASIFLALYFLLLTVISNLALQASVIGKKYYRQAVLTKTLVERELGLLKKVEGFESDDFHLGIAVTPGMRNIHRVLFDHKSRAEKPIDPGSIVAKTDLTFRILIAIEVAGAFLSCINVILRAYGLGS